MDVIFIVMIRTRSNQTLKSYLDAFTHLLYPFTCSACQRALDEDEHLICSICSDDLPLTQNWNIPDNRVERLFWGKINIEYAASYLYFTKGGMVQELLHQLKYHGNQQIGKYLGNGFGQVLKGSRFEEVDCITTVPLHKKKLKRRGYNQCTAAAKELAQVLACDFNGNLLERVSHGESQTKLGRFERWENVSDVFVGKNAQAYDGKHIAILDDVVTTGSTLESCARVLLNNPNTKVSLLTLAVPMPV